jgi:hypothetical protein
MSIPVSELKRWAATLDDVDHVGIDEGGLTLQVVGYDIYLEVGGIPEEDENNEC